MKLEAYSVIRENYTEKEQVERGAELFYLCGKCNDAVPSMPKDNLGCKCGNIFIDKDYVRLVVDDYAKFKVIKANN